MIVHYYLLKYYNLFLMVIFCLDWCWVIAKLSSECLSSERHIGSRKFGCFSVRLMVALSSFRLAYNVLQLQEVGDFEAQNCLPPLNLIRSTKLHLSTEPAFLPNACYMLPFFLSFLLATIFSCLNWWTFNCPVTTINTTIAL